VTADGSVYKTIPQRRYGEALERVEDPQTIAEIEAAVEAIARSPHEPEPKATYRMLPSPECEEAEPLQLMVTVRRLQIVKSGFIVSYTIRESGQLIYLEDLDLPFKYRLPKFQP
jgi:hypothetical protein